MMSFKSISAVLLCVTALSGVTAETPAMGAVLLATSAIQNQQQAAVFPGLFSEDFEAYVGGWGPTTCTTYTRQGFIEHVDGWQSTWATNLTLFNIRERIETPLADGSFNVAFDLQIAYIAKPEFGGPAVNAYDVLQVWTVNPQGTQITKFMELSSLITPSNSTEMLASTKTSLDALNSKNLTMIGDTYTTDATINVAGDETYDRSTWLKALSQSFAARQNEAAFFPQKLYAVCDKYVFFMWTIIELFNADVSSDNNVSTVMGYSVLDADGLVQQQNVWSTGGVAAPTAN